MLLWFIFALMTAAASGVELTEQTREAVQGKRIASNKDQHQQSGD